MTGTIGHLRNVADLEALGYARAMQ